MKIELRAAEGGDDSKLFIHDLAQAYTKYFNTNDWLHRVERSDGAIVITAKDMPEFLQEAGGHRIQRVPPTEKRGRVHTSTVTVSVLLDRQQQSLSPYDMRAESDFEMSFFSGTGCGGQHRNKHQNSVRMTHIPTGLTQTAVSRSKQANIDDAKSRLIQMLDERRSSADHHAVNDVRSKQIGCGMRGDKRRTYRFQEDSITDHETGKQTSCKQFMRGQIDKLWR